jgi:monoamine oxidase
MFWYSWQTQADYLGGDLQDLSLAAFGDDVTLEGNNHDLCGKRICCVVSVVLIDSARPGGYKTLLTYLEQQLRDTGLVELHCGELVTEIAQGQDGVTVHTADKAFSGSHAVVTLPLGVLKHSLAQPAAPWPHAQARARPGNAVRFQPALSDSKKQAVALLGAGLLCKTALLFPYSFWTPGVYKLDCCGSTMESSAWIYAPDSGDQAGWLVRAWFADARQLLVGLPLGTDRGMCLCCSLAPKWHLRWRN